MDADPEIQADDSNTDDSSESPRINAGAAVAILIAGLLVIGLAIYFGVAQTVAGLFIVVGIPIALLWFVWNVFLRR
ncbi:MAG TPA: hypothetical protein VFU86_23935, partial [Terriglobales bacterium]|nr:hypothetical protein [Terriglobales bacterium]